VFTGALADRGITISMDGKGAWRDNVFVERLWRSVKYEEVYLRAYDSVSEARSSRCVVPLQFRSTAARAPACEKTKKSIFRGSGMSLLLEAIFALL
jgi:transposase InsO family protein